MAIGKLDIRAYATLKNIAYEQVLKDLNKPTTTNRENVAKVLHDKFNSEVIDTIYANTVSFPYDSVLYNYMKHKKLSDDELQLIAERFSIPKELLMAKIKEYITYDFSKAMKQKLLNWVYLQNLEIYHGLYVDKENNDENIDFSRK